jgi:hypothetical protein
MFNFLSTHLVAWEYYFFYLLLFLWLIAAWFDHLLVIRITCGDCRY